MGLFGGKKTYVSSTLYNMAGPIEERTNYLKTLISTNMITDDRFSIGDTIREGYKRSPGLRMRTFFRWAENNYGAIGVPTGNLGGSPEIDLSIVQGQIPFGAGEVVRVQSGRIGSSDYSYWAEQWMFDNEPDLLNTDWFSDIDEVTGDITIEFADASSVTFTPPGFNKVGAYIYAYYSLVGTSYTEPTDTGTDVAMLVTDAFPVMTGWTAVSDTTTPDGANFIQDKVYEKTEYKGLNTATNETYSIKSTAHHLEKRDAANVVLERKYRIDTTVIVHADYSTAKVFIYKFGSGNNVLDALVADEFNDGEYLPFIPIRLDNKFLSSSYQPAAYALAKKAYKKATGNGDYDELVAKIAENESLGDIDYAYVMYGVPLNTKELAGKEYLYRFFDKLRMQNTPSNAEFVAWQANEQGYQTGAQQWGDWKDAQEVGEGDPTLFGQPDPGMPGSSGLSGSVAPSSDVHIKSNGSLNTNLDMKIKYNLIRKNMGTGQFKPGAKKGEIWIEKASNVSNFDDIVFSAQFQITAKKLENEAITITRQDTDTTYSQLLVVGAQHINLIYKNKSVDITSHEALEDTEESGFLVPLHYATVREMSLVDSTQMMSSATYIVFNSYKVVKKKWYQTGIFKIFLFIAIIAITVVSMGTAAPAAVGLLGTAAAVGAAVGLTGLLAVIVGTAINALAAMILMKLVMAGASELFGEKLGQIIGAVLAVVTLQVGTAMSNGMSMATAFKDFMSAANIINMTSAVGNGIAGYVQASAMGYVQQSSELMKEYENKSAELSELFAQNIGFGMGSIDTMRLTDTIVGNPMETEQQFLSRTLLTGSDIAEMTNNMLTNFSEITLSTKLPLSG